MQPRNVLSWDQYFITLAEAIALRSKDPSTQVGCIIVDERKHIVSTGYNGPPPGLDDTTLDWSRPAKYDWVIHAELNAIVHSKRDLAGCTLYVTGQPCVQCAKIIVAAGITSVVFSFKPIVMVDAAEWEKSARLFSMAGVMVRALHDEPL